METITRVTVTNCYGSFHWDVPWGGTATDLAKACFEVAGAPYRSMVLGEPEPLPAEPELEPGTCPKCGGKANPEWHKRGRVADMDGELDLGEFGAPVGANAARFVAIRECLRWDCDCGYSWLGKLAAPGGGL